MKNFVNKFSLKARIYFLFLSILVVIICTYGFVMERFISRSIVDRLDRDYENMVVEANDLTEKLLWTLTLTSQQLLENVSIQNYLLDYYSSTNTYTRQANYPQFLDALSSLTMSNTDIALIHFYDSVQAESIYNTLPINRTAPDGAALYENSFYRFLGPGRSQSNLLGNPVFTLQRSEALPNGRSVTLFIETGYYSLAPILQSTKNKSAYLAYTNGLNEVVYTTFPEDWDAREILDSLGKKESTPKFHYFSKDNSQGWSVHIIIPDPVYTRDYQTALRDFLLGTLLLVVLLCILALTFWRSISKPLQHFGQQLPCVLSDEPIPQNIHSTIPEFENIFNKIGELQTQIQDALRHAVDQEKLNTKIQMEKLRAQISPHFLLNTLNTLHWMALMNDQSEIDGITQSLSRLLSYNLDKDSNHSDLKRELDATTEYVRLQKVRYEFCFEFHASCPISKLNYPCPKFIIQPLIENALLHGYVKDMEICVDIQVADTISIRIADTGSGMDADTLERLRTMTPLSGPTLADQRQISFGIGLQYVIQSLNDYYNKDCDFVIHSVRGSGTEILLTIPKLKGEGYNDKNTDC